jgi:hypothetical protein
MVRHLGSDNLVLLGQEIRQCFNHALRLGDDRRKISAGESSRDYRAFRWVTPSRRAPDNILPTLHQEEEISHDEDLFDF